MHLAIAASSGLAGAEAHLNTRDRCGHADRASPYLGRLPGKKSGLGRSSSGNVSRVTHGHLPPAAVARATLGRTVRSSAPVGVRDRAEA